MTTDSTKKDEIYGYQTYYRELGNHLTKLELHQKSLKFYDEAVCKNPKDRRALVARAKARSKAGSCLGALEDITEALKIDPKEFTGLATKAHISYIDCEFEDGLLQNSRILPLMRKPEDFYIGRMNCSSAIETCVGENSGKPLRDHFKIIRKLAWEKSCEKVKPSKTRCKPRKIVKGESPLKYMHLKRRRTNDGKSKLQITSLTAMDLPNIRESLQSHTAEKCGIPPYNYGIHFSPLQKYTTNVENYMNEKYLDKMHEEKKFLKKIQSQPGILSPNEKGNRRIMKLAKNSLSYVSRNQEILRTRRPFYYIKYQEASSSGTLKARQQDAIILQQQVIRNDAQKILRKLRDAAEAKDLSQVLELAEKMRTYCDAKPKRLLPEKDDYMKEVFQKVRRGFFELNRLNEGLSSCDQDRRIYVSCGQDVSRKPSKDSVISHFGKIIMDNKNSINLYVQRLLKAEDGDEICLCHHELARVHMDLKQFDQARAHARKCINEAREYGHPEWLVNGLMLLVRIHIREHNRQDAIGDVQAAMEVASYINDERLNDYLRRCLTVLNVLVFDEMTPEKQIQAREKRLVNLMMNEKLRNEFSHVINAMAALPPSRRMNVLPGVRVGKDKKVKSIHSMITKANSSDYSLESKSALM
ncbi:hypothetical protein JTB14_001454 [Gonioctena quinquepunctata]|nr:hypothetical protein JTB14_001454 [Gonioctena quinquepunctata]